MIRAVLDANVLVSASINPTGIQARLVALRRVEPVPIWQGKDDSVETR